MVRLFLIALVFSCIIFMTQDETSLLNLFASGARFQTKQIDSTIETIELAAAIQKFNDQSTFIDIREKQYFDYGHIHGAINIPVAEIAALSKEKSQRLAQRPEVIIYCNGGTCGTVFFAAKAFSKLGISNVKVYVEGWAEWSSCRLPMDMSEQMKRDGHWSL
jgi:rhodanese-related sulfurtransferase